MFEGRIIKYENYSFIYLDPYYIIEKTLEIAPDLHRVKHFYSWKPEGESIQPLEAIHSTILKHGNILSVSPSKRYCLLLGIALDLGKKQFTVFDIDNDQIVSQCIIEDNGMICNVNNPFAGFSWDEENCLIL